jgi:hypothetical protein
MTLFEILSHDERVIVCSNEGEQIIIAWNQSLTFIMYHYKDGEWCEIEIMTYGNDVRTFIEARDIARRWFGNYLEGNYLEVIEVNNVE